MAYHYYHLDGDSANRGTAILVKDCIYSAAVNF